MKFTRIEKIKHAETGEIVEIEVTPPYVRITCIHEACPAEILLAIDMMLGMDGMSSHEVTPSKVKDKLESLYGMHGETDNWPKSQGTHAQQALFLRDHLWPWMKQFPPNG